MTNMIGYLQIYCAVLNIFPRNKIQLLSGSVLRQGCVWEGVTRDAVVMGPKAEKGPVSGLFRVTYMRAQGMHGTHERNL